MDKGKYGEYLSFNKLEKIKGNHKILTNVYLPKGNGETTELDFIYIYEKIKIFLNIPINLC